MARHIDTAGALAGVLAAPGPTAPTTTQPKLGIVDYVHVASTPASWSHEIDLSHPEGKRYQIVWAAMHESGAKPNLTISVSGGTLEVTGRDTENAAVNANGASVQFLPNPAHARLVAELDLQVVGGALVGTMYAAGSDSHIQGAWYLFRSTSRKLTFACSTAGVEIALHAIGFPHG